MTLILHEIKSTPLFQAITPQKNKNVAAIRPHLYIKGTCVGNLKVQVTTLDGSLVGESETCDIQEISALNEYHGYVTFYLNAFLQKEKTYLVKVVSGGGYVFSESNFVGVCNDYDLRKYQPDSEISHPWFSPLDIEIWTRSQK